jgi:hypothetical protein
MAFWRHIRLPSQADPRLFRQFLNGVLRSSHTSGGSRRLGWKASPPVARAAAGPAESVVPLFRGVLMRSIPKRR